MLSRAKLAQMNALSQNKSSFFNKLPSELIGQISRIYDPNPKSAIVNLLHLIIKNRSVEVQKELVNQPLLLLQAGDTRDSAGNMLLRVTPFECALATGNDVLAAIIVQFFDKIPNGQKERVAQGEFYRVHIENMLNQEPDYNFTPIVEIIKKSSAADVNTALWINPPQSVLFDSLLNFCISLSPCVIAQGMSYNYVNLVKGLEVFYAEYDNFHSASNNNYSRCEFFWGRVIQTLRNKLPQCDREHINNYLALGTGFNTSAIPYRFNAWSLLQIVKKYFTNKQKRLLELTNPSQEQAVQSHCTLS